MRIKKETYDKLPYGIWFIASLFCKHEYKFRMNLYGEQIRHYNWNRSMWYCTKCGKMQLRPDLYANEKYLEGREGYLPLDDKDVSEDANVTKSAKM